MKKHTKDSICRPLFHVISGGKLYPNAWKQADDFRSDRDDLPNWPDWCFLPLGGWYAIVSGGDNRVPLRLVGDIGRLGAIGAWRTTQGIYRFDSNLFTAIADTPVDGDIPYEILHKMPEWCVYIETPGMTVLERPLLGFFAHMEWDANDGRNELRLLLDGEDYLDPIPLHLGPWSLKKSIEKMIEESDFQIQSVKKVRTPSIVADVLTNSIEPLISLLLYLCSQNAEIGDGKNFPTNPQPKQTKKGLRLFPPNKPTTWDVGTRI